VIPLAPRYDPLIIELVRRLDDRTVPIAEVARRVGDGAQLLGLMRPSYPHLRRLVLAERESHDAELAYRAAVREVVEEVAIRVLTGRAPDLYQHLEQLDRARRLRI
jgi:hypothetical protein